MFGHCRLLAGVAVTLTALAGCELALRHMKVPGIPSREEIAEENRMAAKQRERFAETQDRKAIRWLLAKRLSNGMSLAEVNRAIGQDGNRRYADARFKARNTGVIATDESWEWGPDESGTTYVLFFRNERLINFEPSQYDGSADSTAFKPKH